MYELIEEAQSLTPYFKKDINAKKKEIITDIVVFLNSYNIVTKCGDKDPNYITYEVVINNLISKHSDNKLSARNIGDDGVVQISFVIGETTCTYDIKKAKGSGLMQVDINGTYGLKADPDIVGFSYTASKLPVVNYGEKNTIVQEINNALIVYNNSKEDAEKKTQLFSDNLFELISKYSANTIRVNYLDYEKEEGLEISFYADGFQWTYDIENIGADPNTKRSGPARITANLPKKFDNESYYANYNAEKVFDDNPNKQIVCRHLVGPVLKFMEEDEKEEKDEYSETKYRTKYSKILSDYYLGNSNYKFSDQDQATVGFLYSADTYQLFHSSGLGEVFREVFTKMDGDKVLGKSITLATSTHIMGVRLRKKSDGFVLKFYDPNLTFIHKRYFFKRFEDIPNNILHRELNPYSKASSLVTVGIYDTLDIKVSTKEVQEIDKYERFSSHMLFYELNRKNRLTLNDYAKFVSTFPEQSYLFIMKDLSSIIDVALTNKDSNAIDYLCKRLCIASFGNEKINKMLSVVIEQYAQHAKHNKILNTDVLDAFIKNVLKSPLEGDDQAKLLRAPFRALLRKLTDSGAFEQALTQINNLIGYEKCTTPQIINLLGVGGVGSTFNADSKQGLSNNRGEFACKIIDNLLLKRQKNLVAKLFEEKDFLIPLIKYLSTTGKINVLTGNLKQVAGNINPKTFSSILQDNDLGMGKERDQIIKTSLQETISPKKTTMPKEEVILEKPNKKPRPAPKKRIHPTDKSEGFSTLKQDLNQDLNLTPTKSDKK